MLRRGLLAPTCPGTHVCPAGLIETGKTPQEALRREVFEEARITADAVDDPYYEGVWNDKRTVQYFLPQWRFTRPEGVALEPTDGIAEHIGFDWYTHEETQTLTLGFLYREAIDMLHRQGML
ncbi:MAG: NUDIX hydrolase [Candidatus Pacebacteria bacterium]|nr:NUDIX hydrolase [Candidatus Paceibacterota bacterium]